MPNKLTDEELATSTPAPPSLETPQLPSRRNRGLDPLRVRRIVSASQPGHQRRPWGWLLSAFLVAMAVGAWQLTSWMTPAPRPTPTQAAASATTPVKNVASPATTNTPPAPAQQAAPQSIIPPTTPSPAETVPAADPPRTVRLLPCLLIPGAAGAPDLQQCGPTDPLPAVSLPRNLSQAFPSEQVCHDGLAISLACSWQLGVIDWKTFSQTVQRGAGAGPGNVMVWWATGDVFSCGVPTGGSMGGISDAICTFRYHTPSTAWQMDRYFRADALTRVAGQAGCAPPLTGKITSAFDGHRIRVTMAVQGPNGLRQIAGILDTGAVTTLLPDQWLRDAGFEPNGSTRVSGVGNGSSTVNIYRIPRPLMLDGDVWVATGQGSMTVLGDPDWGLPLFGPDLLKDGGITLVSGGGQWTISFPCER